MSQHFLSTDSELLNPIHMMPLFQHYIRARRAFGTGLGPGFLGTFGCTTLTPVDPVTVQAGDVIGACVFDPPDDDTLQNDVVGEIDDSNRYLMTTGTNGCGDAAVPRNVNFLSTRNSRVLHIYADIGKLHVTTFYSV